MQNNKLKEKISNIPEELCLSLADIDKLYSLIEDVAVKFAEWNYKNDYNGADNETFTYFIENIYNK